MFQNNTLTLAAKRVRPNPSRAFPSHFGIPLQRNPLIQTNPVQFESGLKKFGLGQEALMGQPLPGLDPDLSRQNALSNLSQALQNEFHTRNIIRLNNNNTPKSSTPLTETPTPKSVIQPSNCDSSTLIKVNKL